MWRPRSIEKSIELSIVIKTLAYSAFLEQIESFFTVQIARFFVAPMAILEFVGFKTALRNDEPMRNTDQFGVGELHARSNIPVIKQYFVTKTGKFLVQGFGRLTDNVRAVHVDWHEHDVERRQRFRPDNAVVIVVLFDRSADDSGNADSVAPHCHRTILAVAILHRCAHRFAEDRPRRHCGYRQSLARVSRGRN